MDKLDEIILSVLSDDGLCIRGKRKQAERRRRLRQAIDMYMALELTKKIRGSQPVPSFQSGGFISTPKMSGLDDPNRPEYILTDEQLNAIGLYCYENKSGEYVSMKQAGFLIDELQFNEQDK